MNAKILYSSRNHIKKGGGIPLDDVVRVFEKSNNLDEIRSVVKQANDRLYVSWASVDAVDKASERIPIEELASQQDVLLKRHGPITDEHTNRVVGETLAYKILQHPETQKLGILHLNKIHDDSSFDSKVWKEIQEGKRTGSSVGGFNESWSFEMGEEGPVKVLKDFHQYETASVENPANPWALNEAVSVVAKSAKALNDVNKNDTFEFVNNGGDAEMLRSAIAAELSAVSLYEDMAGKTRDDRLRKIFLNVADEEKVHVGEFEKLLTSIGDKRMVEAMDKGQAEVLTVIKHSFNDVRKARVYLKQEQKAPEGVSVQRGRGGGKYYESGGAGSSQQKPSSQAGNAPPHSDARTGPAGGKASPEAVDAVIQAFDMGSVEDITDDIPHEAIDQAVLQYTNNYEDQDKVAALEQLIGLQVDWDAVNKEREDKGLPAIGSEAAPGEKYPAGGENDNFTISNENSGGPKNLQQALKEAIAGGYEVSLTINGEQYTIGQEKVPKRASVIKKKDKSNSATTLCNKNLEGETTMDEEIKKAFSELHNRLDVIEKSVKKEMPPEKKEDDDKDKDDVKKEVNESGKEAPEDKKPDAANQEAVFKKLEAVEKKLEEVTKSMVSKASTSRPSMPAPEKESKVDARSIATGHVKKSWTELNLEAKKLQEGE
jgi:hypothetical protein